MPMKIWKPHPAYYVILEILRKKGASTDVELFEYLSEEYKDMGFRDFNQLLMRLEIAGKIRTTSLARGKKRVELVS
ncbi:MAG: hypothetical protein NZ932_01585 [Candidatus Bathyarchaeota archaeon]|nr:hypothetical protein [Candidatus Bathyarchaeota archaeon]MDW8040055.1 hypothetical protein [Nitrososphaerota archaeon]